MRKKKKKKIEICSGKLMSCHANHTWEFLIQAVEHFQVMLVYTRELDMYFEFGNGAAVEKMLCGCRMTRCVIFNWSAVKVEKNLIIFMNMWNEAVTWEKAVVYVLVYRRRVYIDLETIASVDLKFWIIGTPKLLFFFKGWLSKWLKSRFTCSQQCRVKRTFVLKRPSKREENER